MHPDAERLIELVTRPLAGNEKLRLAVEKELKKALEIHASSETQTLVEAADALERAKQKPGGGRWKALLYVTAVLVSLVVMVWTGVEISIIRDSTGRIRARDGQEPWHEVFPNLSPDQRLLLSGDTSATSEEGRWKPLWRSEPDNAMYLAEYAAAYVRDNPDSPLSPEVSEAAAKIDPDNGWFLALSATCLAKEAVARKELSKKDASRGVAAVIGVIDEVRLTAALALIHESAEKPRFTGYQGELMSKRLSALPEREGLVSHVWIMSYVSAAKVSCTFFRTTGDLLAAGAERCARNNDVDGFRRIISDWHSFTSKFSNDGANLVDVLVAKSIIISPLLNFRDAARSLGMEAEADHFEGLWNRAKKEKQSRAQRLKRIRSGKSPFETRGSLFAGMSAPMVQGLLVSPLAVTDAELRPGRYADHSLAARALACAGWLVMTAAAGTAILIRHLQPVGVRVISGRMQGLLRRDDWCWLFAVGVVLPVVWYVVISRFTPLSPREWSIRPVASPTLCQFVSLLLSLIISPVVIVDLLLAKRGAALGLARRRQWPGLVAAFAALAGVPLTGAIPVAGPLEPVFIVSSWAAIVIAVLWICTELAISVFGNHPSRLRLATASLTALPLFACCALLMALVVLIHRTEEKYWIRKDRLGEMSAEVPAMSGYEHRVTQKLKAETLEFLGEKP